MTQKLQLHIEGMHCGACVRRVTTALNRLSGVQVVNVEIGSAQVQFDADASSVPQIVDTVNELGFTATPEAQHAH